MAAAKKDKDSKLIGTVVANGDVAAFCRKHGPATFSKPHGAEKTVLYYPNPDYEAPTSTAEVEHNEERTPATRSRVIHRARRGTTVAARELSATRRNTAMTVESLGNPNRDAEKAKILNKGDLDKEVIKTEEEARKEIDERTDRPVEPASSQVRDVPQDPVKKNLIDSKLPHEKDAEEKRAEREEDARKSSNKK